MNKIDETIKNHLNNVKVILSSTKNKEERQKITTVKKKIETIYKEKKWTKF